MKILDRYIVKSFLIPFFATFFVVLFVLVMQALWWAFDDIAGKGIDLYFILKYLGFVSLIVTPTALPIGVLLSSIMALGNLSENYEFAAAKSAGVSLKRLMRPLVILTLIISGINFLFLNNIYPYATLRQKNLYINIKKKKPALALIEGVFNSEIPNYMIKFDKKYGEEENLLKKVLIYDLSGRRENKKVITAEKGKITSPEGSKYMTLELENGEYFEDHYDYKKTHDQRKKMPGSNATFDKYIVNIDISSLSDDNLDDQKWKNSHTMLNIKQLRKSSDSLKINYEGYLNTKSRDFIAKTNAKELYKYPDSSEHTKLQPVVLNNFTNKNKIAVLGDAVRKIERNIKTIEGYKATYKNKRKRLNNHDFEFHYRLAFSLSCLVLFFIGAPLGSIIRKGGFGLPMVMAILIFVIYFFINSFGKNIAEESSIPASLGGWLSSIILLPFGILLTGRATKGMGIFNIDVFLQPITKFFERFKKSKTL